jgi:hypothetical protein
VIGETFISLCSTVEERIQLLDSLTRLYVRKLANTERAFAAHALVVDENRNLFEQNNEKKRRQSTRSNVVGKAKVMSYSDIIEVQARRRSKKAS